MFDSTSGGIGIHVTIRQVRANSGVDSWAENLCQGIRKQGHSCSMDLRPKFSEFLPKNRQIRNPLGVFSDIIQGNTWNGFAFKEDVPLVVTEHHVIFDPLFDPYKTLPQKIYHSWIYRCERKSLAVADAVVCVSEYTRKRLEVVYGFQDAQIIYNGVDTDVFQPAESQDTSPFNEHHEDKTILFYAGNLSNRKGGDLLPAIMKELGNRFVLYIATGTGGTQIARMNNIINLGNLPLRDLVRAYNACDIFLAPTRLEGFGLSIAEAMACGKPVVATDCSAVPELVVDGKGGFLCGMGDVEDFSEKIRSLAQNEESRSEMGNFNRAQVQERFSLDAMCSDYLSLYQSVIE